MTTFILVFISILSLIPVIVLMRMLFKVRPSMPQEKTPQGLAVFKFIAAAFFAAIIIFALSLIVNFLFGWGYAICALIGAIFSFFIYPMFQALGKDLEVKGEAAKVAPMISVFVIVFSLFIVIASGKLPSVLPFNDSGTGAKKTVNKENIYDFKGRSFTVTKEWKKLGTAYNGFKFKYVSGKGFYVKDGWDDKALYHNASVKKDEIRSFYFYDIKEGGEPIYIKGEEKFEIEYKLVD